MKQRTLLKGLLVAILLLCTSHSWAYDFSATNGDGVTIYYNVVSSSKKTCEVTYRGSTYKSAKTYSGDVKIPQTVVSTAIYTVVGIGEYAFYNCSSLISVSMPDSISTIDSYAFYRCTGLTGELKIPDSVTEIGRSAFEGCTGLTGELKIPNSVIEIGHGAFFQCVGLTSINFSEGLTLISAYAFYGCIGLIELTIPKNVTTIEYDAFENCINLKKLILEDGEERLNTTEASTTYAPFRNCPLETIYHGRDVSTSSFEDMTTLTSLTIGNMVEEISQYEFRGCTGLTKVDFGNSITTIAYGAFSGCTGLTTLNIPNSVTYIGLHAFYSCKGLTSVNVGNRVETIGSEAFYSCNKLTELILGNSLTIIGHEAFWKCTGLKQIYSLNPEPPTCNSYYPYNSDTRHYVFGDNGVDYNTCVLYVPTGSKSDYSSTYEWSRWGYNDNIVEVDFNTDLYDDLYDDLWEVEDMLTDAWNTIKAKYPNIADDYNDKYKTLKEELEKLFQELLNAYKNGTLDDDMAEEIRAKLEEFRKRIEEFLADAVAADIEDIPICNNNVNGEFQIYTITGARVNTPTKGNVYIFRFSDGTTKKVFIK